MSVVDIKQMQKSQIKRVLEIYEEALIEGKSSFNTQAPSEKEWDKSHLEHSRFVAILNNEVVGWIALANISSRECYKGVCEISVYITKAARGKGIGEKLVKKVMQSAQENGIYSLYVGIFSINTASINLFKKFGFRLIGTREKIAKDRFSNWQDTTSMEYRSKNML